MCLCRLGVDWAWGCSVRVLGYKAAQRASGHENWKRIMTAPSFALRIQVVRKEKVACRENKMD
jgi:hypothetical protein